MRTQRKRFICLLPIVAFGVLLGAFGHAEENKDMQGWGIEDPYNKLYDVREFEKIRAWVLRLKEVVPMPGMSPATALDVQDGSETIEVHLCPTWYRKPEEIHVKKGDRIKLKGVWAEVNGRDVFMASKIKKDPDIEIIKVRLTKDGKPFWAMTPEELAAEQEPED